MRTPIDCTIASNKFGYYCVPNNMMSQPVVNELMHGAVYEHHTIGYIREHCGTGTIVHAGAFVGDMLPAISGMKNYVLAFEPVLTHFRCAQITMQLNFLPSEHRTKLINKGLGSEYSTGTVPLVMMRDDVKPLGGESRILQHVGNTPEEFIERIDITTIDFEVPSTKNVSVIHLDVEGYEEQALMGAKQTLRDSKPMLILEIASEQYVDTPFYEDFIFGELGYEEVERHRGNRFYIVP